MKLTLVGGGGVRSPLFVMSLLRWSERIGVDELCLMDVDGRKLELFGGLCREIIRRAGDPFTLTTTRDAWQAFSGASHVVTTIRVGFEEGRALDERIALRRDVLGQETTGPGGFAMALRSIPALLGYAELLQQVSPGAWMYNFTNPAGLVTQALHDAGFTRTVGICDGANGGQAAIAHWAGVPYDQVQAEVFGLNHLSWCRRAWVDGRDVLPEALADERFLREMQGVFEPELVRQVGMHCNEYLYYYYYAERAVQAISAERQTRGEEIVELNRRLVEQLEEIGVQRDPERALRAFFGYEQRRGATYMNYAHQDAHGSPAPVDDPTRLFDADIPEQAGEGYAGVALAVIEALEKGGPLRIALNTSSAGARDGGSSQSSAIPGMQPGDVVEVSCLVDRDGIHPQPTEEVPPAQMGLMQAVKLYERLTVQAVRQRSRQRAIQALMAHPLVVSYSRAAPLVDEYLAAHRAYVGDWA